MRAPAPVVNEETPPINVDGDANTEASGGETNAALDGIADANADVVADAEGDSNANDTAEGDASGSESGSESEAADSDNNSSMASDFSDDDDDDDDDEESEKEPPSAYLHFTVHQRGWRLYVDAYEPLDCRTYHPKFPETLSRTLTAEFKTIEDDKIYAALAVNLGSYTLVNGKTGPKVKFFDEVDSEEDDF
eukprot:g1442.t1